MLPWPYGLLEFGFDFESTSFVNVIEMKGVQFEMLHFPLKENSIGGDLTIIQSY